MSSSPAVAAILKRNLIFVGGKGGVGKTAVSQAIALAFSRKGKRTLWISFEDPFQPSHEVRQMAPGLWHLNCDPTKAFEEYAELKIGVGALARLFLQNKLMRYLSKAAPGIHELVLLGKVWHERLNYEHIVVDLPSTGYGLAMFQSTVNFAKLFHGGPVHRDAEAMIASFRDPRETGHLIVALPEEMPLRESLELRDYLLELFHDNPPGFVLNRRFPRSDDPDPGVPDQWPSPIAASARDYARKRTALEEFNVRLWRDDGIAFMELPFLTDHLTEGLAGEFA